MRMSCTFCSSPHSFTMPSRSSASAFPRQHSWSQTIYGSGKEGNVQGNCFISWQWSEQLQPRRAEGHSVMPRSQEPFLPTETWGRLAKKHHFHNHKCLIALSFKYQLNYTGGKKEYLKSLCLNVKTSNESEAEPSCYWFPVTYSFLWPSHYLASNSELQLATGRQTKQCSVGQEVSSHQGTFSPSIPRHAMLTAPLPAASHQRSNRQKSHGKQCRCSPVPLLLTNWLWADGILYWKSFPAAGVSSAHRTLLPRARPNEKPFHLSASTDWSQLPR